MRKLLLAVIVAATTFGTLSCGAVTGNGSAGADSLAADSAAPQRLTLLFAGDLMQHKPQADAALTRDGKYDFDTCFDLVRDEVSSADVAIANFEITTAGPPYSGYPRFGCPDSYVSAVKNAGFDLVTTNNNHSCDRDLLGINRTIQVMDSLGLPHFGTYRNKDERESLYPYLMEKNGFRIVFLSYTYGTNGIPVPSPAVVNLIDRDQIAKDIAKAKTMNADAIIALMHWGEEYTLQPVESQKSLANWMFEQGVTHIIGGHPHVVEPIEVRKDSKGNSHVLAYSLANFISNQSPKPGQPKDGGIIFRMDLVKDSTVRVENCRYSLHWVSKPGVSGRKNYRIIPANVPDSSLNQRERALMRAYTTTARTMFQKSNKGDVKEYKMLLPKK